MRGITPRTLGVEEEFHLVDLQSRRLTARAPELLSELSDTYVAELQRCVIETNSGVVDSLDGLRADLRGHRAVLVDAATRLGIGVVAAGAVPLSVPAEMQVTQTARYRQMLADYQLLAREQLICGTQVHVGIDDRDEAVVVARRVAPYLPTLLALSASSPFWADGSDTGYSSGRTLVWQRWPTTGLAAPVSSAAEYDELVSQLIASGVITDAGMVYFDARPAIATPTLELRICDSCPSVDTIVLIAGLFRALVEREIEKLRAGAPAVELSPPLGRAALWRAARSGLEGELVDTDGPVSRPAADVVSDLVRSLRPQLEAVGDWDTINDLTKRVLIAGTSAGRQRRALRRRGRLTDVVDQLIAETAGNWPSTTAAVMEDPTLLFGYHHGRDYDSSDKTAAVSYDEAVDRDGTPRPAYAEILRAVAEMGVSVLRSREGEIEQEQRADGIMFRVSGQSRAQVFPLDLMPRLVSADDWSQLTVGLGQRAKALNAFLRDIYSEQEIVKDGLIGLHTLDRAPGFRSTGQLSRDLVRAHVSGTDLVCDRPGSWMVLEDNLRIPSGTAYAVVNRRLLSKQLPELVRPADISDVEQVPQSLLATLRAAAPPQASAELAVALLSAGWDDSAWFEHTFLAEEMGVALVQSSDLSVRDGQLWRHMGSDTHRVDVLYARMDEDMVLSSTGYDGAPLRDGLLQAVAGGTLTIANSLGNGVADDKAIYAYVPAMIEYYLGETPALAQVPTWICAERDQRDYVLDNLSDLVTKPIDGLGGSGVVIGPEASAALLENRHRELRAQPERYIAQEVIALSTHPTFDGEGMYPHHVDLRAFVHLRAGQGDSVSAHVMPAALTRVATLGSRIVNSSSGGGSKDTWIQTGNQSVPCSSDPDPILKEQTYMCGICGEIRWDGESADVAAVTRMTSAMASRGPDSDGVFAQGPVAFGHRRLSIIDLSARGAQPMVDSDLGLTLVFNGCIYNYQELRKELEAAGYQFFSTADSEVVIKAFHRWGVRCVERFKGMFAFAIADRETGVVTLARDRLGIKPLYLAETPGRLRFASTMRALIDAGDVDTELDRHALHHYMSFHSVVPAPRTIYCGVRKLPAATVRVIAPDGSYDDTVFWTPVFERDAGRALWSPKDWQDALMDALRTAVERRMVADVPVGVLLSGGIDSSIVVALLAEQGQHGLSTFSIGFDSVGDESGDEFFYSDLIAETFSTDHHRIHIDSSRLLPAVPKTLAAMSEPMVSHDCVAFYLLSEEVSKSVKVVQSGQGADEILAGYDWYPPLANVAREHTTEAYAKVFFDRAHADIVAIFAPEYGPAPGDPSLEFVSAHQSAPGAETAVDAALRLDTQVMLVDDPVKRVDTMTMAWGLEARVPFLDHDFVELAATCPAELKLASGGKGVLKDASRALLPSEVIDRTKGYFPVPGIRHLHGEMFDMVHDALTNDAARARGLYRSEAVDALLAAPNERRTTLGANALWQLAVLEMWLQGMQS